MIEIGLYRHHKGDFYFVEGSSISPDTNEEIVHYRDAAGYWQHRSLAEFTGLVDFSGDNGMAPRYMKVRSLNHPAERKFG